MPNAWDHNTHAHTKPGTSRDILRDRPEPQSKVIGQLDSRYGLQSAGTVLLVYGTMIRVRFARVLLFLFFCLNLI